MKLAIVGSGISGLICAYRLDKEHEITLFEADNHIGGHTHTHDVELDGKSYSIDTGFIVYNDWTYPNFIALLEELKVPAKPSSMSFSVKCERTGIEYNGTTLNSLFAQRRNILNPAFLGMIRDIIRFNREAPLWLDQGDDETSLGDYLKAGGYSKTFQQLYIIPMGAAIWSSGEAAMLDFPAKFFLRFFHNHGMLSVDNRPTWRVVEGGSKSYVEPMLRGIRGRVLLETPVESIKRDNNGVWLKAAGMESERFDAVVLACHSDQALKLLQDASNLEREILGAIPYQENEAILHTDSSILPRKRLAWAAWNYHILKNARERVVLSYDMNILQGITAPVEFLTTLNYSEAIDPARIIKRLTYHHPVFTQAGIQAQQRHGEISGINRTYFCGAYWGFGFHEDGLKSGIRVVGQIRQSEDHA